MPHIDEPMQLVTINDLSYSGKLLMPIELLSEFTKLLAKCRVVQENYMTGGMYCIKDNGPAGISSEQYRPERRHTYAADATDAEVQDYVAWHNATHAIMSPQPTRIIQPFADWIKGEKEK